MIRRQGGSKRWKSNICMKATKEADRSSNREYGTPFVAEASGMDWGCTAVALFLGIRVATTGATGAREAALSETIRKAGSLPPSREAGLVKNVALRTSEGWQSVNSFRGNVREQANYFANNSAQPTYMHSLLRLPRVLVIAALSIPILTERVASKSKTSKRTHSSCHLELLVRVLGVRELEELLQGW